MASQYWIRRNSQTAGPFTSDQIKDMVSSGMLVEADLISDDQVQFKPAGRVAGLFGDRKPTPPPSPTLAMQSPACLQSGQNLVPAVLVDNATQRQRANAENVAKPNSSKNNMIKHNCHNCGTPMESPEISGGQTRGCPACKFPNRVPPVPGGHAHSPISVPPDVPQHIGGWEVLLAISISCCLVVGIWFFVYSCWALIYLGYYEGVKLEHIISCALSFSWMCLVALIVVRFFGKRGIGGWLIIPAVGLSCLLVYSILEFMRSNVGLGNRGYYEGVDRWDIILLVLHVLYVYLVAFVAISFFGRKEHAPICFIVLLNIHIVPPCVVFWLIANSAPWTPAYYIAGAATGAHILIAAFWVSYFLASDRVKATFVR